MVEHWHCLFDEAWRGPCKETATEADGRCLKHSGKTCVSCGAVATRDCGETGQFVCGAPLCNDCEHTIFPDGTNGGIGFNGQALPAGLRRHVRKDAQQYRPWHRRQQETGRE